MYVQFYFIITLYVWITVTVLNVTSQNVILKFKAEKKKNVIFRDFSLGYFCYIYRNTHLNGLSHIIIPRMPSISCDQKPLLTWLNSVGLPFELVFFLRMLMSTHLHINLLTLFCFCYSTFWLCYARCRMCRYRFWLSF